MTRSLPTCVATGSPCHDKATQGRDNARDRRAMRSVARTTVVRARARQSCVRAHDRDSRPRVATELSCSDRVGAGIGWLGSRQRSG